MSLVDHVERELSGAMPPADVVEAVRAAAKALDGPLHPVHATIVAAMLSGEVARPLTGEADEWRIFGRGLWQNVRCDRVFRRSDDAAEGPAYEVVDGVEREIGVFPYMPGTYAVPRTGAQGPTSSHGTMSIEIGAGGATGPGGYVGIDPSQVGHDVMTTGTVENGVVTGTTTDPIA